MLLCLLKRNKSRLLIYLDKMRAEDWEKFMAFIGKWNVLNLIFMEI